MRVISNRKSIQQLPAFWDHLAQSDSIFLGIPVEGADSGILQKLGFSDPPTPGETVLPSGDFGRVAHFNAHGREVIRKDLPKETVYHEVLWERDEWDGPYTRKVTDWIDRPYKKFPRELISPPSTELSCIEIGGQKFIGIEADNKSFLTSEEWVHRISLVLNVFRTCHVVVNGQASPVSVRRINWKLLPKGDQPWPSLKEQIEKICAEHDDSEKKVFLHRLEMLSNLGPDDIVVGQEGFGGYVAFFFARSGRCVVESAYYGNATYVLGADWQSLILLTKAELINGSQLIERIVHKNKWRSRVLPHTREQAS